MSTVTGSRYVQRKDTTLWSMLEDVTARDPDKEALVGIDADGREVPDELWRAGHQARVMSGRLCSARGSPRLSRGLVDDESPAVAHFSLRLDAPGRESLSRSTRG